MTKRQWVFLAGAGLLVFMLLRSRQASAADDGAGTAGLGDYLGPIEPTATPPAGNGDNGSLIDYLLRPREPTTPVEFFQPEPEPADNYFFVTGPAGDGQPSEPAPNDRELTQLTETAEGPAEPEPAPETTEGPAEPPPDDIGARAPSGGPTRFRHQTRFK